MAPVDRRISHANLRQTIRCLAHSLEWEPLAALSAGSGSWADALKMCHPRYTSAAKKAVRSGQSSPEGL